VAGDIALRPVAWLRVKGKGQAVEVFEPFGERAQLDAATREFLAAYEAGYVAYCERRFAEAVPAFGQAAFLRPEDFLTQRYLAETRSLAAESPAPDWEPVLQLHTK
jgi:adenylate cyclase